MCFSLVCGVGCGVWLVLGGVRLLWDYNLNNISVLFKSPSGVFDREKPLRADEPVTEYKSIFSSLMGSF